MSIDRKRLCLFFLIGLMLVAVAAFSQTPAPSAATPQEKAGATKGDEKKPADAKPVTTPPEPPPDSMRLSEITKMADPQKKLEGLQKFLIDFPKSRFVDAAENQILTTLVKSFPDQKEKILAQANKVIDAAPESMKIRTYNTVASLFLDNGVLLGPAEEFAKKGLSLFDEKKYVQDQKDAFARRKKAMEEAAAKKAAEGQKTAEAAPAASEMKEPAEEELVKQFQKMMASSSATLAQIWLKKGKYEEAAKLLKKCYDTDPTLAYAATGLAELAARDGHYAAAVNYYSAVALTGRMSVAVRKQFEDAYAKSHKGSLAGLEEMLDARYKKDFPLPVNPERYKPAAGRTNRVVLAEIFTGSGCPPCVGADLAFEGEMERFDKSELAVLMFHLHIPTPDPIANPSTQTRAKLYKVNAVPSMFIDGVADGKGGGPRDAAQRIYDRINPKIEKELDISSRARIQLQATSKGSTVVVKAKVDQLQSDSKDLKLQIALVEEELRYSGENGIRFHPMVVRSLAGPDATGFAVDAEKGTGVEYTFDLPKITAELKAHLDDYEVNGRHGRITFSQKKHEMDPAKLAVVAFVQDEATKQVLQASYVNLSSAATAAGR